MPRCYLLDMILTQDIPKSCTQEAVREACEEIAAVLDFRLLRDRIKMPSNTPTSHWTPHPRPLKPSNNSDNSLLGNDHSGFQSLNRNSSMSRYDSTLLFLAVTNIRSLFSYLSRLRLLCFILQGTTVTNRGERVVAAMRVCEYSRRSAFASFDSLWQL